MLPAIEQEILIDKNKLKFYYYFKKSFTILLLDVL